MVMPMPPWSCTACWPTRRLDRPICTLAAAIVLWRSASFSSATIMVASIAMLRACSSAISMSTARCCSTWNVPIGTPNCRRVFRYSTVSSCMAAMAPTASAHKAAIASSTTRRISAKASPGLPIAASGSTATFASVSSAPRHARRRGVDQKQADALRVAAIPGDAGTDQKLVGAVAVQHQRLGAVEHEAGAVAARAGGHVGEMIARLALAVRERQQQAAVADLRQQRRALLVAAAVAQQPAAEHHRGEERFERQRPAERLRDDHGLDRAAAEAPETLLERQPEQPELGVFGPQLAAKTFRRLHVGLARLELVMVRQQPLDAVLEQPLLLVQLEVHLSESRGSIVMAGPGSSPGQALVPAIHAFDLRQADFRGCPRQARA